MSAFAGAVTLHASGADAAAMSAQARGARAASRASSRWTGSDGGAARATPTTSRPAARWSARWWTWPRATGWRLDALRTEEGQLDEVFRRITLPDTVKDAQAMSAWHMILTIAKRELAGYFASPVAYVFLVIFLLLTGFFTFTVGGFFERGEASLASFFIWHPVAVPVPGAGGRHAAVVRGTARRARIELLLTLPIAPWQAILGKFLASWLFLAIALGLTFPVVLTVNVLGEPDNGVDPRRLPRQPAARGRATWRSPA